MLKSYYHKIRIEAGLDEVGRGCLAGPVVVAAVILPKDFECKKLKDSKRCSPKLREELAGSIRQKAVSYAVEFGTIQEIDSLNISNATFLAMDRAVLKLIPPPQHLLVDGHYFRTQNTISYTPIVKGDNLYANIAAASILAKTSRDNYMKILSYRYPNYKWQNNKGYPTPEHKKAINTWGRTNYHRKHYRVN